MAQPLPSVLASGAIFGAALTSTGVWYPSIIDAQVHFRNFHMVKVFLTASATSAVAILALERLGWIRCSPRKPSNWGWVGQYDGNIIGGVLLGAGMTLAEACPGTVLVQVAMGIPSGLYALAGVAVGGILFVRFGESLKRSSTAKSESEDSYTIQGKLHLDPNYVLMLYEAAAGLMLALTTKINPHRGNLLHPITGGFLVGSGQIASLLFTKQPVGVSSAFEDFGKWFWYILGRAKGSTSDSQSKPAIRPLLFAGGIIAGSWALAHLRPGVYQADAFSVTPTRAVLGGTLLAIGARVGGGCTSGHGISGMAMFSIASVISVCSMFGGAFTTAAFL